MRKIFFFILDNNNFLFHSHMFDIISCSNVAIISKHGAYFSVLILISSWHYLASLWYNFHSMSVSTKATIQQNEAEMSKRNVECVKNISFTLPLPSIQHTIRHIICTLFACHIILAQQNMSLMSYYLRYSRYPTFYTHSTYSTFSPLPNVNCSCRRQNIQHRTIKNFTAKSLLFCVCLSLIACVLAAVFDVC